MNISTENMNLIFDALRRTEGFIMQHTGIAVKCRVETIQVKGSPKEMMSIIAESLDEDPTKYYELNRTRSVVDMRMIAAHLVRKYYASMSLSEIGKMFGEKGLDHTSIIHYLKTAEALITNPDKPFTAKYRKAFDAVQLWMRS